MNRLVCARFSFLLPNSLGCPLPGLDLCRVHTLGPLGIWTSFMSAVVFLGHDLDRHGTITVLIANLRTTKERAVSTG